MCNQFVATTGGHCARISSFVKKHPRPCPKCYRKADQTPRKEIEARRQSRQAAAEKKDENGSDRIPPKKQIASRQASGQAIAYSFAGPVIQTPVVKVKAKPGRNRAPIAQMIAKAAPQSAAAASAKRSADPMIDGSEEIAATGRLPDQTSRTDLDAMAADSEHDAMPVRGFTPINARPNNSATTQSSS